MAPPVAPRRRRVTGDPPRARAHAQANLGLAEKYLGDVPEAKKVFAFLQSTDYNPLTSDQTKQVNEVRSPAELSSGGCPGASAARVLFAPGAAAPANLRPKFECGCRPCRRPARRSRRLP